jgi:general secretion pathway protein J
MPGAASPLAKHRGFTLLELLVAVAIFAVLAVISYSGLNSVLKTREHTSRAAEALHELQMSMTIIQRDLSQIADHPIRDQFGDRQPGLLAGEELSADERLIEFTRHGWRNPAENLRSTLQRVAYALEEETLYRAYWPRLYRGPEAEPLRAKMLDDVERVLFEFQDERAEWHEQWPPLNIQRYPGLPLVVRLNIEFTDETKLQRYFPIQ